MIKYNKKIIPAREIDVVAEITCDLCGRVSQRHDWASSSYKINDTDIEVRIRQTEGTNYPEGASGTEIKVDMCPVCFKEKLIPWLKSQGAKIEEKEWSW